MTPRAKARLHREVARYFRLATCALAGFTLVLVLVSTHARFELDDARDRLAILVDMRAMIEDGYRFAPGSSGAMPARYLAPIPDPHVVGVH